MKKLIILMMSGLVFAAAAPLTASAQISNAQTSNDRAPNKFEAEFVEKVRSKHPDFRIVKKIEAFPERYNASVELSIVTESGPKSEPESALVTLHDGVTGEPMESCFTPCTLHKSPGRTAFVFAYKRGYLTRPIPIRGDYAEWAKDNPNWGGVFRTNLGLNYHDFYRQRRTCARKVSSMDKTEDTDAIPCYRVPPVFNATDRSGRCELKFDVSPKGYVENARAVFCTDQRFEAPSLAAVNGWAYTPKIERGMAATRLDVKTTLRFNVMDFDGNLLDESGAPVEN